MIFVAPNILVPEVIQAMYRTRKAVEQVVISTGETWSEMCIKVPIVKAPGKILNVHLKTFMYHSIMPPESAVHRKGFTSK